MCAFHQACLHTLSFYFFIMLQVTVAGSVNYYAGCLQIDDNCLPTLCHNGATCIGKSTCQCTDGYFGDQCDYGEEYAILKIENLSGMAKAHLVTRYLGVCCNAMGPGFDCQTRLWCLLVEFVVFIVFEGTTYLS